MRAAPGDGDGDATLAAGDGEGTFAAGEGEGAFAAGEGAFAAGEGETAVFGAGEAAPGEAPGVAAVPGVTWGC